MIPSDEARFHPIAYDFVRFLKNSGLIQIVRNCAQKLCRLRATLSVALLSKRIPIASRVELIASNLALDISIIPTMHMDFESMKNSYI